jgi:photosystem II stability/assembly factor-like uncharacterized protein
MSTIKYKIILFFITIASQINGQSLGEQLKQILKSKRNLTETMTTVDSFYARIPQEIRDNGGDGLLKIKFWKRWAWEQSKYLGPNREFVNSSQLIFDADEIESRNSGGKNRSQLPGSWQNIGIENAIHSPDSLVNGVSYGKGIGRIDRIAFHPTDPNTFYVGAPYGGLWKTTNGGTTWKCLTDTIPSIGIAGIVVDWNNPNNIYILTGTADNFVGTFVQQFEYIAPSMGVMKSTDAGLTWNFVGSFPLPSGVTTYISYALVQNPVYAAEMLAATSAGVFLSLDSGVSWTRVRDGQHFDVMYKPNDPDRAYCTTNDSIYYSADYGQTWTLSSVNIAIPSTNARIALCGTNAKTSNVYAICGSSTGAGSFVGVYKSVNNGVSFTRIASTPNVMGGHWNGQSTGDQGGYDIGIAVSHTDTTRLNTAGINVWRSTNGGINYTAATYWIEWDNGTPAAKVHADHHALVYNKLNNRLYSCNDGGLYYSTDHGITWVNISKGLVTSQFYHLTQFNNGSYILSGGQQDNGLKFRGSGTKTYTHIGPGDGFQTAFQPNNSNIVYISLNQNCNKINVVTGQTMPFTIPSGGTDWYQNIMTHVTDTNRVYVGADNKLFTSTNQGASWTTNNSVSGNLAMAQSPSTPNTMYIAGGANYLGPGNIWRTTNLGSSWTNLTTNPGFPTGFSRITDIAINPTLSTDVYVTFGGFTAGQKVFFSSDGGNNWQNFSFNLPNIVAHCVTVSNGKVYVGTDLGIYRRNFVTNTWVLIRDNMPKTPISDIHVDLNTGNLICSTFGRGVWQRDFCVNDIALNYPLKGKLEYESNNQITSTSLIPGINNVDSILMTSGKVLLQPGFKAKQGTHMKAAIGGCDNGAQPFNGEDIPKSDGVLGRKE